MSDMKCPECKSNRLTWICMATNTGDVVDGRLRLHEIDVLFVLGCDDCSETVAVRSGADVATALTQMCRTDADANQ